MENLQNQDGTTEEENTEVTESEENESDTESNDSDDSSESIEDAKLRIEALEAELAAATKAKNKASYKAYAKSKKSVKEDDKPQQEDIKDFLKEELDTRDYFRDHPDVDKADIKKIMSEEWRNLDDAIILSEGRKMKDEGYRNQKEAGRGWMHWTFDNGNKTASDPFATWPKLYSS